MKKSTLYSIGLAGLAVMLTACYFIFGALGSSGNYDLIPRSGYILLIIYILFIAFMHSGIYLLNTKDNSRRVRFLLAVRLVLEAVGGVVAISLLYPLYLLLVDIEIAFYQFKAAYTFHFEIARDFNLLAALGAILIVGYLLSSLFDFSFSATHGKILKALKEEKGSTDETTG